MKTLKRILCFIPILIMSVELQAQTFTSFVGSVTSGSSDGTGSAASFNGIFDISLDDVSGDIYVADVLNHKIRKVTSAGVVTTLAGTGSPGSADGTTSTATFFHPVGVLARGGGNVAVADGDNNKIRGITSMGMVTTLAGSGSVGSMDGFYTSASFYHPTGLATDGSFIYVTEKGSHVIRKISSGLSVTWMAGGGSGFVDGPASTAKFNFPLGIDIDASGNLYVADRDNHSIRKITPAGDVSTIAGSGVAGSTNGTGAAASFNQPVDVALDAIGNIYVCDGGGNGIRRITPSGVVTTFSSFSGSSIAISPSGVIYVGTGTQIFKLDTYAEIAVSENSTNISDGGSYSFGTTTYGNSVMKTYTISNTGTSTLTLTAPASIMGYAISSFPTSIPAGGSATFTVTLDASFIGTSGGSLSFVNNDADENPFNFTITGTVNASEIAVSENSTNISDGGNYSFGSTPHGTSLTKTFTISNSGTSNLTVNAPAAISGFTIGTFPASIPAGSSATFTITMDATSAGTPGGTISFITNDPDENPFNFTINGTVSTPAPEISVSEISNIADGGSYSFGTTIQGTFVTKTFTISNSGTSTLTLISPTFITGFAIGTFPTSIAAGSTATFSVTLDATSVGTATGTISFANNDSDENPFDINISGTVTAPPAPEISVTENSVTILDGGNFNFGSTMQGTPVSKTFTITNSGTATLTLTAPSSITGFTFGIFPNTIAAGSSATFIVIMDATSVGTPGGSLSFATNDSDEDPFNINISGTVTAPPASEISVEENSVTISDGGNFSFGITTQGTSVIKTFTIANTGTATLTLTAPVAITGFTIGTFPTSIASGSTATFTITMDATSVGTPCGTISFATNDSDENPFDIVISGTVTILESVEHSQQAKSILVYPNRISAGQTITIQSESKVNSIELVDLFGNIHIQTNYAGNETSISYSIPSKMSSGIYYLKVNEVPYKIIVTD